MTPFSRTTVIMIIVALLIVGAAVFLLFGQDARTSGIASEDATEASEAEQVFLNLTARIVENGGVELNTAIFDDERFKRLQDIRMDITPEASGRIDPFAPLDGAVRQ